MFIVAYTLHSTGIKAKVNAVVDQLLQAQRAQGNTGHRVLMEQVEDTVIRLFGREPYPTTEDLMVENVGSKLPRMIRNKLGGCRLDESVYFVPCVPPHKFRVLPPNGEWTLDDLFDYLVEYLNGHNVPQERIELTVLEVAPNLHFVRCVGTAQPYTGPVGVFCRELAED